LESGRGRQMSEGEGERGKRHKQQQVLVRKDKELDVRS
jgi:hypothetical protein